MTEHLKRLTLMVGLIVLASMILLDVSHSAQGRAQNNNSSRQTDSLKQTVQKQDEELKKLKSELEELKKTVANNGKNSSDWNTYLKGLTDKHEQRVNYLKGIADKHTEKFNTHDERSKWVTEKLNSHDKALTAQEQGLVAHHKRLIAIENYIRSRPR